MIGSTELQQLVRRLASSGVREFEAEGPGLVLRLRLRDSDPAVGAAVSASPAASMPEPAAVRSPGMGHLSWGHPVGTHVPVEDGATVSPGQVVAFLKVGELIEPVIAERGGRARRIAQEGALVGYADRILALD